MRNYHGLIRVHFLRTIFAVATFALLMGACTSDEVTSSEMSEEQFCRQAQQMGEANNSLDEDDPEAIASAADQMELLADTAPSAIKADLAFLADVFNQIAEVSMNDLAAETPESEEAMGRYGEVMALMMSPEVLAAGDNIERYLSDVCGMEPSATDE